jgi:integrase
MSKLRTYGSGNFWASKSGTLYFRVWVDHVRFQFRLGKVSDFPTQKARDAAAREKLATLPTTSPKDIRNVTLADFAERTYLPWAKDFLRLSTYNEYKGMYERHVKAHAGKPIRHYGTPQVQDLLNAISEPEMSITSLRHVRMLISGVFKFAKQRGLYTGENPTKACRLPSGLRPSRPTPAYTLQQINAVMSELNSDLEARAIVAVCAFAGLRRSEVQGLRWQDWDDDQLHVKQSVFNGKVNEPKSQASKNWVPVIPQLHAALEAYKAHRLAADQFGVLTADSRMFIYTLDHYGRKIISAAFRRAKVKWEGFHGFRRGLASNLFELGASDLLVMRVLRHASVQVTRSSYIKVRDGILEAAMMEFSQKLGEHQAETGQSVSAK